MFFGQRKTILIFQFGFQTEKSIFLSVLIKAQYRFQERVQKGSF